jgi:hypothetical protein
LRLNPELDLHEYVAMYTDDFAIAMKDTQLVTDALTEKYNFRLMGKRHIKLHLGCNFDSDDYGTFHMTPETYVERMNEGYERMIGSKTIQTLSSTLKKDDHTGDGSTESVDLESIEQFQSPIRPMQWGASFGHIDITAAVTTLSSFRAAQPLSHRECEEKRCDHMK